MATSSLIWTALLVCAFAGLITVHVATVYGLARSKGVGAAALGLLLPPAAPYQAFLQGMRVRAVMWLLLAAIYVTALIVAAR